MYPLVIPERAGSAALPYAEITGQQRHHQPSGQFVTQEHLIKTVFKTKHCLAQTMRQHEVIGVYLHRIQSNIRPGFIIISALNSRERGPERGSHLYRIT